MSRIVPGHSTRLRMAVAALILLAPLAVDAQRGGSGAAVAPRQAAPVDLTGYWVSIVTEDWRFRMLTPARGDYESVPINAEARRVADAWDPARDQAAGEECRWYGAASIMSVPGRLHITWESDDTLRVETDAGRQTRHFRFARAGDQVGARGGAPSDGEVTWQGESTAAWRASPGGIEPGSLPGGSLEVHTTKLRPGYLRRNGVPYSAETELTEFYYVLEDADVTWLIVITVVEDPQYLTQPFVTSRQFMKQADAAGWNPTACSAR